MNIADPKNNGSPPEIFDLEELHDRELVPLIRTLCDKAQAMGVPIFITACYKSDNNGAWLASSARGRGTFVPQEFHIMRALVEGRTEVVDMGELMDKIAG